MWFRVHWRSRRGSGRKCTWCLGGFSFAPPPEPEATGEKGDGESCDDKSGGSRQCRTQRAEVGGHPCGMKDCWRQGNLKAGQESGTPASWRE
jgi:hypothetical protein